MKRKLPAYPLFIKDPNFSFWSCTDELNGSDLQTWYGEEKKVYGFVKIDDTVYCFMGDSEKFSEFGVEKAKQTEVKVSLFATEYEFLCGSAVLKVRFVSPLPLNDLPLLSLPVTYMEYELDGEGEVSVFVNRNIGYNERNSEKTSRAMSIEKDKYQVAFIGLKRQLPLSNNNDVAGADWGYFYLSGETAFPMDETALKNYLTSGAKEFAMKTDDVYICSINGSNNGLIMLGYDERVSIDYFGEYLKGYYLDNHTIFDALEYIFVNREKINSELDEFADGLIEKAKVYGDEYIAVINAAYRQSVGAHKLVKNREGELLFLSKECGSNGCIATVDITYPSMPLFLLYDTELVKGMLRPIFRFAESDVWKYDFAPHDCGTYPHCSGQVYGLNTDKNRIHGNYAKDKEGFQTHFPMYLLPADFEAYDINRQMMVEESANILIVLYACYRKDGDAEFFKTNYDLCAKWAGYLVKYGLKPENQICTDDFAGHLKNNINLAIKATVAVACYAELLDVISKDGIFFRKTAEEFAKEIADFSERNGHLPISWDSKNDTFSLKYNFAFDKILKLNLFDEKVFEREIACYTKKLNRYGIPLDCRNEYTKSDWLLWVASLTDVPSAKEYFIKPIYDFLICSPNRIPFSDWYETDSGKTCGSFKARSVQGGLFILLLKRLFD